MDERKVPEVTTRFGNTFRIDPHWGTLQGRHWKFKNQWVENPIVRVEEHEDIRKLNEAYAEYKKGLRS